MIPLMKASQIGLIGDLHGDTGHLPSASEAMVARGVAVLLVLGNFGFVGPERNRDKIATTQSLPESSGPDSVLGRRQS